MWDNFKTEFNNKKILITGHTGFKGSWMVKTLSMLGADITGISLPPQDENVLFNSLKISDLCNSIYCDIRERSLINNIVNEVKPDFIFHFAAQPLVRLSYERPAETFEVNAIGTANILDSIKQLDKPCFLILITTDKVYHNYEWSYPYRENDRLGGYDPYSASKACAELIIDSYRNSYFKIESFNIHQKAIAVGRAGNVIGGGDWSNDRLLPDIMRALYKGDKIEVRNPDSIRPWQHVLESIRSYLLLAIKLKENPKAFSKAYNFGPGFDDTLSVKTMVELVLQSWGAGEYIIKRNINAPHEAGTLKLDISKAIEDLNWFPKTNAKEGIIYTVEWYKIFLKEPEKIIFKTESQIIDFFDAL